MSSHESPIHREPEIDDVSADSPNSEIMLSTGYENGVGDKGDVSTGNGNDVRDEGNSKSADLSKERKRCFLLSYAFFVVMFIAFCFGIALFYPLKKPALYVKEIYVPVFDKFTPNISAEMKNVTYVTFKFENRNKIISISYDNFIYVDIYYVPSSPRSTDVRYGNVTFYGFNQNRGKPLTKVVETPTPGMSSLLKIQKNSTTMIFRVYIDFIAKYHCLELGIHKHRFEMTADVKVSLESGRSSDGTIRMYENQYYHIPS